MSFISFLGVLLFALSASAQTIGYRPHQSVEQVAPGYVILGGNAWNRTSSNDCDTSENNDFPSVVPSVNEGDGTGVTCDNTASPSPEPDPIAGTTSQYLQLLGYTTPPVGNFYAVSFQDLTTAGGTGTYVFDGYIRISNFATTGTSFLRSTETGANWTFPQMWGSGAKKWVMYCTNPDSSFSTPAWVLNTWYKYRIEWNETGGKGNCTGVNHGPIAMADDCVQCGCLFIDDVEVASCTNTTGTPTVVPRGFEVQAFKTTNVDNQWDNNFMCKGNVPPGKLCGDGAMPKD